MVLSPSQWRGLENSSVVIREAGKSNSIFGSVLEGTEFNNLLA